MPVQLQLNYDVPNFLGWRAMLAFSSLVPVIAAFDQLTDKEKETLRLIVRGHDAKSAAKALNLSVHTINERLRAARRKLDVTSSKEAARILLENEEQAPENLGYKSFGDASTSASVDDSPTARKPNHRRAIWIGGIVTMSLLVITLALALAADSEVEPIYDNAHESVVATLNLDPLEDTARDWLRHVDARDWDGAYSDSLIGKKIPASVFNNVMTDAFAPLGKVTQRKLREFGSVQTATGDSRLVYFTTDFENRKNVIETVTLSPSDSGFKVSGYWINESEDVARTDRPHGDPATNIETAQLREFENSARQWLTLVDASEWATSFDAAGQSFQDLNTVATWQETSLLARVPLGNVIEREAETAEFVNAPPQGYVIMRFRSSFENRERATEVVTLENESGEWKVVGYVIE